MAKYYVQSGTLRTVVEADSSRRAAMWAVHQTMQQVLPIESNDHSPSNKSEAAENQGLAVLSDVVFVSEHGFSSDRSQAVPTMEVVGEWNEMCAALNRLEQLLQQGISATAA